MRPRLLTLLVVIVFVAACSSSSSPAPSAGGFRGSCVGRTGRQRRSVGKPGRQRGGGGDLSSISGTAVLSGWRSSPEEGEALTQTLLGFPPLYPNVQVDYQPIAGDYRAQMVTKFGATRRRTCSTSTPSTPPSGSSRASCCRSTTTSPAGIDTSKFFPDYLTSSRQGGKTFGLPKDGNTIAMAVNTDLVTDAPKTMDELVQVGPGPQGQQRIKTPMCLNAGLDRGLAFLYAQGGSLLSDDEHRRRHRHRRVEGGGPVVPRPVQERARPDHRPSSAPAGAARRWAREGRHRLRGWLARGGDDGAYPEHQVSFAEMPDWRPASP